jgi:hypothetical protein
MVHEARAVTPKVWLALLVAWLLPGAGHLLLGRIRRGLLFAAIVWCCFGLGLAHTGRLALKDPRQPFLTTLQVVANLGVGPADLIARVKVYGKPAYSAHSRGPKAGRDDRLSIFRQRERSSLSIYGTAYLWTAGLMNLLLLFDVWDIGRRKRVRVGN